MATEIAAAAKILVIASIKEGLTIVKNWRGVCTEGGTSLGDLFEKFRHGNIDNEEANCGALQEVLVGRSKEASSLTPITAEASVGDACNLMGQYVLFKRFDMRKKNYI